MHDESFIEKVFLRNDTTRVRVHLSKLIPYLDLKKSLFVGGIAIRYHLLSHGVEFTKRPFNDLDLVVEDPAALSSHVTKRFLVYHYHPQNIGQFYIALVDPESQTKVDIFSPTLYTFHTVQVSFEKYTLRLPSIEDQLVKTILDISRISPESHVDPKQFEDARMLYSIADTNLVERYWKENNINNDGLSALHSYLRAKEMAKSNPGWIEEKPFDTSPYVCGICRETDEFQVEPMEKIYDILGRAE